MLRTEVFDKVFTSGSERAVSTAKAIAHGRFDEGLIAVHPCLAPKAWGTYTGKARSSLPPQSRHDPHWAAPEGEAYVQLMQRVSDCIDDVGMRIRDGTALLVTHRCAI